VQEIAAAIIALNTIISQKPERFVYLRKCIKVETCTEDFSLRESAFLPAENTRPMTDHRVRKAATPQQATYTTFDLSCMVNIGILHV